MLTFVNTFWMSLPTSNREPRWNSRTIQPLSWDQEGELVNYTKEGIMAQVCVAFGQGTGEIRVSQEACVALYDRYVALITDEVLEEWGREAVQALERIRVLGRMVAAETRLAGYSVVSAA